MRNLYLVLICTILLFYSCASKVNILKPQGETATLTFTNLIKPQVEILAIADSTIFVKYKDKISDVQLNDIKKISIHEYRINPFLKIISAIPPLLGEAIVMNAAFSVDQPAWGVISGFTIAGTIYGFATGNLKTRFSAPFDENEIENLKLFCRYPQGLSSEQWKILLQHFNQDDFVSLFKNYEYIKK